MIRIDESEIVRRPGLEPTRVVISQHNESENGFCTHWEVMPEERAAYLISGHYDLNREAAVEDMASRLVQLRKM